MAEKRELPDVVRSKVHDFTLQLASAIGSDLAAVVVHGSSVRGGYHEGQSDIDVVIVLERDSRATLEAAGEVLAKARSSYGIEAMIVTAKEIAGAADVFPLLYDDLGRESVCVHGGNPFARIVVSDAHRRLRIEQELRQCRIRLRRAVSEARGERIVLRRAVWQRLRHARSPMAALLRLRGQASAGELDDVMTRACHLHELDPQPLVGEINDPFAAYETLCTLLDRAIAHVDELETSGRQVGEVASTRPGS